MKLLVAHGKIPRPSCLSRHSEPEFEKIVLQLHTLNWVGAKEREVYFLYLQGRFTAVLDVFLIRAKMQLLRFFLGILGGTRDSDTSAEVPHLFSEI